MNKGQTERGLTEMANNSKIEWTNGTIQPVIGCDKISEGCMHCYALPLANRLAHNPALPADVRAAYRKAITKNKLGRLAWSGEISELPGWREKFEQLCKGRPKKIFIQSMGDLCHDKVPGDLFIRVLAACAKHPEHIFQMLTKRPARALKHCEAYGLMPDADQIAKGAHPHFGLAPSGEVWPENLWFGITAENQEMLDKRAPFALQIPTVMTFLSHEPSLGPLDARAYLGNRCKGPAYQDSFEKTYHHAVNGFEWVICGGESGPGARPMHPDWARSLRDQCQAAEVPFFFKQWGEWSPGRQNPALTDEYLSAKPCRLLEYNGCSVGAFRVGKKAAGCLLDGVEHKEFPGGSPK